MRIAALTLAALCAVALAACSSEPAAPAAATTAPPSAPAARPATAAVVRVADLPPAPPVETWVQKGSDFQQTLDLNMQTELIELGLSVAEADEDAARELAYAVCSALRSGTPESATSEVVQAAYPTADQIDSIGIGLAAQAYCLDTVSVG